MGLLFYNVSGSHEFFFIANDTIQKINIEINSGIGNPTSGYLYIDDVSLEEDLPVNDFYGYNGKERLDESYGVGNAYDYGARMYEARLGRWLSVDPLQKKYPDYSPYIGMANNPIYYIDADGRIVIVGDQKQQQVVLSYMKDQLGVDGLYSFRKDGSMKLNKKLFNEVKGSFTPAQLDIANGINKVIKAPRVVEVVISPDEKVNFKRNPIITSMEENPFTGKQIPTKVDAYSKGSGINMPIMNSEAKTVEADPQDDRAFIIVNQKAASTGVFNAEGGGKTNPSESSVFIHELLDHGLDYIKNGSVDDSKKTSSEKVSYHNKALENKGSSKRTGTDHE